MNKDLEILNSSPIYAMSLGSHELFHSNIWAWMMKKYPSSIHKVFSIEGIESPEIKREFKNRDITIKNEKSKDIWIIENKFKSIPYAEQLQKYKDNCLKKEKFCGGILTCISKPEFEVEGWSVLTYEEILSNIEEFLPEIHDDTDYTVLKDYILVTKTTVKLIKDKLESVDSIKLSGKDFDKLEANRISDILRKLVAQKFVNKYREEIIKEIGVSKELIYIDTDYTNKNAIINAFILLQNVEYLKEPNRITNKEVHYNLLIGVQIQGESFRLGVSIPTSKDNSSQDEIFDKYSKLKWFDGEFEKGKNLFEKKTKMAPSNNKKYNKYIMQKNKFIYQYFDLCSDEDKRFENVKDMIVEYLQKAKNLLKEEGMLQDDLPI